MSENREYENRGSTPQHGKTRSRAAAEAARKRRAKRRRKVMIRRIIALATVIAVLAAAVILVINLLKVKNVKDLNISTSGTAQTLSWTPVNDKYSYEIYRLVPGSTDRYELAGEAAAGASSYTVDTGSEVTLNTYKVVSLRGNGRSGGRTISAYTAPASPSQVAAATASAEEIDLTWNATDAATGFTVYYSENEDMSNALSENVNAQDTKSGAGYAYAVKGLSSNTTYYFQIQSYADVNEKGYEGKYSSSPTETVSAKVWRSIAMDGIDVNAPMVALTFDDGPDYGGDITYQILDVLERYGCLATFFQIGQSAQDNPEVMQRILAGGHEIGSHTYNHEHYGDDVTAEDITRANDLIEEACGVRPTAFRSPGGETTDLIREVCVSEDTPIYYWAVDTRDWESRDTDSVINITETYTEDGDIILMHNVYYSTADAVDVLVPWLLEQGYQLVTVSQLIQAKTGEPPVPGLQYYNGDTWN